MSNISADHISYSESILFYMDTIVMKLLALVTVAAVSFISLLNNSTILLLGRLIPSLVLEIEKYDEIEANSHNPSCCATNGWSTLTDDG